MAMFECSMSVLDGTLSFPEIFSHFVVLNRGCIISADIGISERQTKFYSI